MFRARKVAPALVVGLVLIAACQDHPTPVAPIASGPTLQLSSNTGAQFGRFRPGEELSAAVATEVPGFGGFYVDDTGNIHAYLLDMKNAGVARAALVRIVAATRRDLSENERKRFSVQPQILLRQGQYEFTQLADWRNEMTDDILKVSGVVYNGLDEHVNRLVIGVDRAHSAAVRPLVERKLAEIGIPRGAVTIEDADPISLDFCRVDDPTCVSDPCTVDPLSCEAPGEDPCEVDPSSCTDPGTIYPEDPSFSYAPAPSQTLGSKFTRLFGAVRIRNYAKGGGCTLGFVATYDGIPAFATNSHCSSSRGYLDNSNYYQPTWNHPQVGQEMVDNGKMSWGKYISDVSLARIQNVSGYLGYIARTVNPRSGTYARADTAINSSNPYMRIISEVAPRKDYEFHKVGATTGWTYGLARKVCYDTSSMRCVSWVAAGADDGDSGAPVFRYYGADIGLAGLVYAKADGGFWMTPMSQIRIELNASGTSARRLRTY